MAFDWAAFARFTATLLFRREGTSYRWTPKRVAYLLGFYLLFFPLLLSAWIGFLLDELFYPRYRDVDVSAPVFIIGNPRSGTTFLHRLLARDRERFISIRTWELFFAPSIVQRKLISLAGAIDDKLGAPVQKVTAAVQRRWQAANDIHRVALRQPEEDEYLLFYIWSCLKLCTFGAMLEEAQRYVYFDQRMPPEDKGRIMGFYESCLKRHLYFHRRPAVLYLAKDPSYTPMVDTLLERYPRARFIYMVRNPLDMIPSYISLTETEWQLLGHPVEPYACREWVLEMAKHWYNYPLERLAQEPESRYTVIKLEELSNHLKRTVTDMYEHFGWRPSPRYAQILSQEAVAARHHNSDHDYSLEEMGLSRERVVESLRPVFERHGFDTRAAL